ncbi:hypothetical protein GALMADRAFT_136067 [Galerina marginata CBS 339.88]|uniref:Hydrophobin n=1 Tax=Galerina marginata (strain CBS 339.88) TaxID=685588 RepID=A0A067TM83_GALM3|nr:hypothetical protein GALMADRAFT_136067 [Galerina marginata CBS 339.88]
MFARASTAIVLALPILAVANVLPQARNDGPSNQCNTGTLQCCSSVQSSSSSLVAVLLGLLGVAAGSVTGQSPAPQLPSLVHLAPLALHSQFAALITPLTESLLLDALPPTSTSELLSIVRDIAESFWDCPYD